MSLFLPDMDALVQQGGGLATGLIGQTYDVRRLDDATNGSIFTNAPAIAGYLARLERITKRDEIENATFDLLTFAATCDNRTLELGDVCTETGCETDGGTFVVAQKRPTRVTLWVRTELRASVERPADETDPGGWGGEDRATDQVLTLAAGVYAYADPTATRAIVPFAVQPLNRVGESHTPNIPDDFGVRRYIFRRCRARRLKSLTLRS